MKKTKLVLLIIGLAFSIFSASIWWNNRHFVMPGDKKVYNLDLGEHITIKLYENSSTGYENCWINEEKCSSITLTDREYDSSVNNSQEYVGAGGYEYLTFTSKNVGIDTIKIASCPTGVSQKTCDYFKENSTVSDIQIVIKVE